MTGFLFISFLAGVLTVLAPCILPLLPVIIGGSMAGTAASGARRVFVIVMSLGISVFAFTLLLKASTAFIAVPPLFWQLLSGGLIVLFGIATLFPRLWDHIPGVQALYKGSNRALGLGYQRQSIWGDALMGAALGPVFSSCSPTYFVILAAVLPANFAAGVLYLLAYVLGLCLFLFMVALVGQRAAAWLGLAADSRGWFKKAIGILFILVGLAIIFGIDKQVEAALPASFFGEIGIEQNLLTGQNASEDASGAEPAVASSTPEGASASAPSFLTAAQKALRYKKAPELTGIEGYINTANEPITLSQYLGKKVVLIDFWDYSCINCQRTFPYLKAWWKQYEDEGLVIIGVHTPEFAFEQKKSNVEAAAERFGLAYPIVLDNQYKTWSAFQNQFWPREYLVDIDGYIVHDHAGEGGYAETEKAIQAALAERASRLGQKSAIPTVATVDMPAVNFSAIQSPETYFGASRNGNLGNGTPGREGTQTFTLPQTPSPNTLYLGGTWSIKPEYAEAGAGASILYYYNAHDVYMVAVNTGAPVTVQVLRDGKPVGSFAGEDVDPSTSEATIDGDRLYTLVHDETPGAHTIEIRILKGTLDVYTFTFG